METHEYHELIAAIPQIKQTLADLDQRVKALESPEACNKRRAGTVEEVKLLFAKVGLPETDAEYFWNKMQSSGWRNSGKVIRSWTHCVTAWKLAGIFPSQKNGHLKSTPRDLTLVLQAKRDQLNKIKDTYSSETASGRVWMPSATPAIRLHARKVAEEIKEIQNKLATSL